MVKRIGTSRRGSRYKFRKNYREKGKISIRRFLQEFEINERVALVAEPSYQKGLYHSRFHGKIGKIVGKQGRCYKVALRDGSKEKVLIVHPVHLKRVQ